jgi:transposase-like protein
MLRIPCPNGHVLKTKRSMLGQQVVCPSCNEFFTLEETASLEYKQEAARRRAHEDEERAQKWLWRAIYSAIFIVLSFIVMAVIGSNPQWFQK